MEPSQLIKKRRKELGLTLEELGKRVGVSKVAVKKWEDGAVGQVKTDNLAKLAKVLDLNPVDLLGDVFNDSVSTIPRNNEIATIPIIKTIDCDTPILSKENIIGEMQVFSKDVRDGEYFGMIAKGDAMQPKIEDGDYILVRRQYDANNGDIVAVSVDGDIKLKRFKRTPTGILLIPENRNYDPIILANDSQNYIVGKATNMFRKL